MLERTIEREPARDESLFKEKNLHVMLDNIRSAWNVGSIFRTADGFGFKHLYLCGITPTPDNEAVTKTSLGAEDFVTWSAHKDAVKLASGLKKEGFAIWALEQTKNSELLEAAARLLKPNHPIALVVGSEVTGVDPGILEIADKVVHLPMRGQKRSFNVAIAFAIAAALLSSSS
ncbi:MAG: TrmH family RNA methyltransferase [Chloroflexi bacterium]|nr:TrmH family RNA methyltransferase [Chloroflexota bacterium]